MTGKTQHFEGADGRLYFHYPLHARYLSKTTTGEPLFEHEITTCEYIDGKELYTLACNGAPITGAKTLEQVDLILGFFDHDMTEPGERVELPLLEEEVRLYYEDLAKAFSPKSAFALNIKWAEEDAIYLLNELKQKKMAKATPNDMRKIFNA